MTITIYVKNKAEYEDAKRQIKIHKKLPRNTRIVFLKDNKKRRR